VAASTAKAMAMGLARRPCIPGLRRDGVWFGMKQLCRDGGAELRMAPTPAVEAKAWRLDLDEAALAFRTSELRRRRSSRVELLASSTATAAGASAIRHRICRRRERAQRNHLGHARGRRLEPRPHAR